MYTPSSFAETTKSKIHDFIEQHSFATLVSASEELTATHLPLLLDRDADSHGKLIGHMARANSLWKDADGSNVLAVFTGPHAYISPTWYGAGNVVPTWNYTAVHASGTLRVEENREAALDIVRRYVDFYEASMPQPWSLASVKPDFIDSLLDAIVGFTIDINKLEGKWKLSQNHDENRRMRVVKGLRADGRHESAEVADLMNATVDEVGSP